jgi:hypothetical protein
LGSVANFFPSIKRFKSLNGFSDFFDESMVLSNDVVEVFDLSYSELNEQLAHHKT